MGDASRGELTNALRRWARGEPGALDHLVPHVYPELRQIAAGYLSRERPGTLQATALVHDLYLRLLRQEKPNFENRRAFFGFAADAMRHLLIDQARARRAAKRGAGRVRVPLDEGVALTEHAGVDLLDLDDALADLTALDPRKAELVSLCAFLGCSRTEAAELLGVSVSTAKRDFRLARAWLSQRLGRSIDAEAEPD